jgi:hypothetical protein
LKLITFGATVGVDYIFQGETNGKNGEEAGKH